MSTAAAAPLTPKPETARETIVEFKDVWKRYGNKEILAGVNLTISRGEVLCVLGPSGTGKSVTIRHINGLTQPDDGDIRVFDESVVGSSYRMISGSSAIDRASATLLRIPPESSEGIFF